MTGREPKLCSVIFTGKKKIQTNSRNVLCCHVAGRKGAGKHNTFSGYYFTCTEHETGLVWRVFWAPWVLSVISYSYFINVSVCWSSPILIISPLSCWVLCVCLMHFHWDQTELLSLRIVKRETDIYQLLKCDFFFLPIFTSLYQFPQHCCKLGANQPTTAWGPGLASGGRWFHSTHQQWHETLLNTWLATKKLSVDP